MVRRAAGFAAGSFAFAFYVLSLAPGLTWAHQGADGAELLTAAIVNGVPHPPGYPLYTLLLQGWLALLGMAAPASDLAWRGNLLSALSGAASVFLTVIVAHHLLPATPRGAGCGRCWPGWPGRFPAVVEPIDHHRGLQFSCAAGGASGMGSVGETLAAVVCCHPSGAGRGASLDAAAAAARGVLCAG